MKSSRSLRLSKCASEEDEGSAAREETTALAKRVTETGTWLSMVWRSSLYFTLPSQSCARELKGTFTYLNSGEPLARPIPTVSRSLIPYSKNILMSVELSSPKKVLMPPNLPAISSKRWDTLKTKSCLCRVSLDCAFTMREDLKVLITGWWAGRSAESEKRLLRLSWATREAGTRRDASNRKIFLDECMLCILKVKRQKKSDGGNNRLISSLPVRSPRANKPRVLSHPLLQQYF